MFPTKIEPTKMGLHGPVPATVCRVSADLTRLAFWSPEANPPGLFVGDVEQGDQIGMFAKRVFTAEEGSLADVANLGREGKPKRLLDRRHKK